MKRSELAFNLVSIPVDMLSLLTAGIVSFYLRSHVENYVGPVQFTLTLDQFLIVLSQMIAVLILGFAVLGLYNLKGTRRFITEFGKIALGTSLGLLIVVILFFFNQTIFPSRFIILATWVTSTLFVWVGRYILKLLQEHWFMRGRGLHNLVIVNGDNSQAAVLMRTLKSQRYGYNVIAEIPYTENTIEQLEKLFAANQFDEIIQANPDIASSEDAKLVEFARSNGIQFSFAPNLFEVQRNSIELTSISGVPVVSLKNSPLDGWGKVTKRVFDILASLTCLILASPLYLAIYIAVKLDSKGPAIYRQIRGGHRRDFVFFKFRTMYTHLSDGDGYGGEEAHKIREELWRNNTRGGYESPFLKIKDDPRVTRVGKFLRKTKLDEIPQFWNVLSGHMSMVGPRAHMIEEVVRYRDKYRRMFSIKPGIFGMSQNTQILWPDLPFEEEIKINTFYIENWSVWLDIVILVKSFYLIFFAKKPEEDF